MRFLCMAFLLLLASCGDRHHLDEKRGPDVVGIETSHPLKLPPDYLLRAPVSVPPPVPVPPPTFVPTPAPIPAPASDGILAPAPIPTPSPAPLPVPLANEIVAPDLDFNPTAPLPERDASPDILSPLSFLPCLQKMSETQRS